MSEYAVRGEDARNGSLLAALAEAGFLLSLERNRFAVVSFVSDMSILRFGLLVMSFIYEPLNLVSLLFLCQLSEFTRTNLILYINAVILLRWSAMHRSL